MTATDFRHPKPILTENVRWQRVGGACDHQCSKCTTGNPVPIIYDHEHTRAHVPTLRENLMHYAAVTDIVKRLHTVLFRPLTIEAVHLCRMPCIRRHHVIQTHNHP